MATRAESLRTLVAQFDAAAVPAEEIAKRLGISADRVEQILDQLDAGEGRPPHPDDAHRAPAVEPVRPSPAPPIEDRQPIVVGSHSRVVPSVPPKPVEVRPVPTIAEVAKDVLAPPEPVLTAEQRAALDTPPPDMAAEASPLVCGDKQGTRAGYQRHRRHDDPACDACLEANRAAGRKSLVKVASQPAPPADDQPSPSKGLMQVISNAHVDAERSEEKPRKSGPTPCGSQAAYKRHLRHGEKPCDACVAAHSEYMRSYRDKPMVDMPEGVVALLTLPLSAAHLSAVADVLEMAYGPDLRLTEAPGGLWVLGRAS